jgi:predicted  nucleic acid-binding Zn-ribbon protein
MKASPEDQAKLVEVGRIDMDILRATKALASLPEKAAAAEQETHLVSAREEFRRAQEEVDGLQSELARAESDVELVDKRIALDTERLATTSSAKDAQGFEHELASLAQRKSLLEDLELEIMEKLEQASALRDQLKARVAQVEATLGELRSAISSQTSDTDASLAQWNASRQEIVATLPEDLVALYDRQRERYGQGVSVLTGTVSSASGVQLTESDLQTIRKAADDEVVLCPDSNAILVRGQ